MEQKTLCDQRISILPFADLATMSLPDYIAREAAQDTMWFFLHIPKTAGSSFATELSTRMKPYRNVHVDYNNPAVPASQQMAGVVEGFAAEMQVKPFRSASGHVPWHLFETIQAARPDTRVVTFLRNPEARVISDYRYQRTPMHPPYREFIAQFPTLESYAESPQSHNKIAKFIYGRGRNPSAAELIAHIGRAFTFVGLVEMYPLSFNAIFAAMGQPGLRPAEHKRKTPDTKDTAFELTDTVKALIRETNQLDQAAFDYVRGILARHRDAQRGA